MALWDLYSESIVLKIVGIFSVLAYASVLVTKQHPRKHSKLAASDLFVMRSVPPKAYLSYVALDFTGRAFFT